MDIISVILFVAFIAAVVYFFPAIEKVLFGGPSDTPSGPSDTPSDPSAPGGRPSDLPREHDK